MKFNDTLSGLALLALSLLILLTVRTYPDIPGQNIGPGAFPGLLAWLLALCSVLLILKGLNGAIASKKVTYDFARLMEGATEIKCSAFGTNIIEHM